MVLQKCIFCEPISDHNFFWVPYQDGETSFSVCPFPLYRPVASKLLKLKTLNFV